MTTCYLDSSALSKRYVEETGTPWLRGILAPAAGNAVVTARITMVELHSALARRLREGSVAAYSFHRSAGDALFCWRSRSISAILA